MPRQMIIFALTLAACGPHTLQEEPDPPLDEGAETSGQSDEEDVSPPPPDVPEDSPGRASGEPECIAGMDGCPCTEEAGPSGCYYHLVCWSGICTVRKPPHSDH